MRRKEQLWPHVREFADRGITLVTNTLRRLQEASEPCALYTIHGAQLPPFTRPSAECLLHNALRLLSCLLARQARGSIPMVHASRLRAEHLAAVLLLRSLTCCHGVCSCQPLFEPVLVCAPEELLCDGSCQGHARPPYR